jgi:NADH dehydrogenase
MTTVIVGGGPTGVELAGALAELKRQVLAKDFRELPVAGEARVILLEAAETVLGAFPQRLGHYAGDKLAHMGVDVRLGAQVASVTEDGVLLADGKLIAAANVIWVAGVRAVAMEQSLGLEQTRSGRLLVDETLQVASWPNVFVVGDMASVSTGNGSEYPMLAPVAIQQGRLAGANIVRLLAQQPLKRFAYRDHGTMATIGRQAAAAKIGPLQLTGLVAWVMWLTVHLVWLIGFRNRLLVLTNWAWNYVFFERGASSIIGDEEGLR